MTTKINALRNKVQNLIDRSEYRGVKVLGVTCSRADLEIIVLYLDTFLRGGNINGLMTPCGNVKQVIEKAEIVLKD